MMPCRHASTGRTCLEMILCTAAIAVEPVENMDCYEPVCLWEVYQASGSYEDCCRWLKHRAWMKGEGCV
jgi:hypothetical protein